MFRLRVPARDDDVPMVNTIGAWVKRRFPSATANRAFCNTSAVAALLQNMLTMLQVAAEFRKIRQQILPNPFKGLWRKRWDSNPW